MFGLKTIFDFYHKVMKKSFFFNCIRRNFFKTQSLAKYSFSNLSITVIYNARVIPKVAFERYL